MRVLVDEHGDGFWARQPLQPWLGAAARAVPHRRAETRPRRWRSLGTEAWGRRMLNTQLASWAELRHDTILYAKQTYTGGVACEFPDALVEPYPAFFARLGAYAAKGERGRDVAVRRRRGPRLARERRPAATSTSRWATVAAMLQEMAELPGAGDAVHGRRTWRSSTRPSRCRRRLRRRHRQRLVREAVLQRRPHRVLARPSPTCTPQPTDEARQPRRPRAARGHRLRRA